MNVIKVHGVPRFLSGLSKNVAKSGRFKVEDLEVDGLEADGLKVDGLKVNTQTVNHGFWQSERSKVDDPKSKVLKWSVFKWTVFNCYVQRRRSKWKIPSRRP